MDNNAFGRSNRGKSGVPDKRSSWLGRIEMATRSGRCLVLLVAGFLTMSALAADFSLLLGPYLGQPLPGRVPMPSAHGLITLRYSSIAMTPDGREICWASGGSQQSSFRICFSERDGDGWTYPAMLFDGVPTHADCPGISPDGQRLYLDSVHPLIAGETEKERIWGSMRQGNGWYASLLAGCASD